MLNAKHIEMKKQILLLLFLFLCFRNFAQSWTANQLNSANAAKDIACLTDVEKDAVMYINLARLYPKLFVKIELINYTGTAEHKDYVKDSKYKESLITFLNSMTPVNALSFDSLLYENARCFAKESGDAGIEGHDRIACPDEGFSECCSYGMFTGKDIAMQFLIDLNVPGLGHREVCLDGSYSRVGPSVHAHKVWGSCAVLDFY
jgi:hypothetical protein